MGATGKAPGLKLPGLRARCQAHYGYEAEVATLLDWEAEVGTAAAAKAAPLSLSMPSPGAESCAAVPLFQCVARDICKSEMRLIFLLESKSPGDSTDFHCNHKLTAHGNFFLMARLFFFYDLMQRSRTNFTDRFFRIKRSVLHGKPFKKNAYGIEGLMPAKTCKSFFFKPSMGFTGLVLVIE